MRKYKMAAGLLLAFTIGIGSSVSAAAPDDAKKQENQNVPVIEVKDGDEVLTEYTEQKGRVYVAAVQSVIRELPEASAKGQKKVTLGKWLNRIGVCENGWSVVTYRDRADKKCTGYIETKELSDKPQLTKVSETLTVREDADILDYPGLKDGQVIGEYIEGDTVQRTGICNEAWSQVSFRNEAGKKVKGYLPTKSLDLPEERADEEETEAGALRPTSGESIFVEASKKVTAGGTIADGVIVGDAVAAPKGAKLLPLGVFRITHYCPCSLCCGPWADGITSTGVTAVTNRTIAVDPTQIPYGSKVVINGQVYVAEDCGGGITQNCIDIYVASHEEGEAKGVYYTDVYLLEE